MTLLLPSEAVSHILTLSNPPKLTGNWREIKVTDCEFLKDILAPEATVECEIFNYILNI